MTTAGRTGELQLGTPIAPAVAIRTRSRSAELWRVNHVAEWLGDFRHLQDS